MTLDYLGAQVVQGPQGRVDGAHGGVGLQGRGGLPAQARDAPAHPAAQGGAGGRGGEVRLQIRVLRKATTMGGSV